LSICLHFGAFHHLPIDVFYLRFSLHWLIASYASALTRLLHLGTHCLCVIICIFACHFLFSHCFLLVLQVFYSLANSSFMLHLIDTFMSYNVLPFATFCWSNALLFCYIVLQYIGCFFCLLFVFPLFLHRCGQHMHSFFSFVYN
jgi:hypothetical protein